VADTEGVVVRLVATKIIANVKVVVAAIMRWILCGKSTFLLLLLSALSSLLLFSVFILRSLEDGNK
jgi:hypothetical protein